MFRQRRFADAREREGILDAVRATGEEPHPLETDGWLCARLHLSRPLEDHTEKPAENRFENRGQP